MALKLSVEDSKSANGCGGFIKLRGEISVSVEDMVPSFKSGVGVENKAVVISSPANASSHSAILHLVA